MPTRDELTRRLEQLGGRVANTVSRKTDLVLVGTSPGEVKVSRARELGIPMLSLTFTDYLGLFDRRRGPRGLCSLSDDFLFDLAKFMCIYTEELYAHSRSNDRAHLAFLRARDAARRLLRLAWGTSMAGDVQDWADDTSHLDRSGGTGGGIEGSDTVDGT